MRIAVAFAIALCLSSASLGLAQTNDVPRDHWAYRAVQDLANKGYVTGSPFASFPGDRTLTRYEFASIIKRMLDNLDSRMMNEQTRQTVSQEDQDKIFKLADEFTVELLVTGARPDKLQAKGSEEANKKLTNLETIVTDHEGAVEATKADVAKLKKVVASGYIQTRYEEFPGDVDEDGKTYVPGTFNVRRARLKITAKPTDYTAGVLQLDMGGNKASVKDAYVEHAFKGNPETGPFIDVGQMNWWFGYEVPYSSSKRETPERALWARRFFPGERDRGARFGYPVNDKWFGQVAVYDGTGIETVNTVTTVVTDSTTTPPKTTKLKTGSNVARDYDNHKDVIGNLQYMGENMEFGLSGYVGKGIWNPDRSAMIPVPKTRLGADFRYFMDNLTLKAEYVTARGVDEAVSGFDNSKWLNAYDVQLGFNVSSKDTLVARYESLSEDPRYPAFGRRSAWNLGALRWLDERTRVKLFYIINQEEKSTIDNNIWRLEWLMTY